MKTASLLQLLFILASFTPFEARGMNDDRTQEDGVQTKMRAKDDTCLEFNGASPQTILGHFGEKTIISWVYNQTLGKLYPSKLRTLVLKGISFQTGQEQADFSQKINLPSSLIKLDLRETSFSPYSIHALIKNTPGLRILRVNYDGNDKNYTRYFNPPLDHSLILLSQSLPETLETFEFSGNCMDHFIGLDQRTRQQFYASLSKLKNFRHLVFPPTYIKILAAEKDVPALKAFARMYQKGKFISGNNIEAREFYHHLTNLATMYDKGVDGVHLNKTKAETLYKLAAEEHLKFQRSGPGSIPNRSFIMSEVESEGIDSPNYFKNKLNKDKAED